MVVGLECSYYKMSEIAITLFLKLAFSQSDGVAVPSSCIINLFKYLFAFIRR